MISRCASQDRLGGAEWCELYSATQMYRKADHLEPPHYRAFDTELRDR